MSPSASRALAWLGLLLALLLAVPTAALDLPPRPQGPIADQADLLPAAEEAQLDQRLRDFDAKTGNAVIVATVNSLGGDTIEDYAAKLYAAWGIGGAEHDTGVLLLVAPNEHKVRIEVGYGLTPYITDILSGRIIRDDITPKFKQGDMAGGILAGLVPEQAGDGHGVGRGFRGICHDGTCAVTGQCCRTEHVRLLLAFRVSAFILRAARKSSPHAHLAYQDPQALILRRLSWKEKQWSSTSSSSVAAPPACRPPSVCVS